MPRIRDTHFDNPRLNALGVEVMPLARLARLADSGALNAPERLDFHLLLLVTAGQGLHTVDFVPHRLRAHDWLTVQPGQVQHWRAAGGLHGLHGLLLLATPLNLLPAGMGGVGAGAPELALLALDDWQTVCPLPPALARTLARALRQLARDIAAFDGCALQAALIRHGLMALLLRVARAQAALAPPDVGAAGLHAVYRLFVRALQAHFAQRLGVTDYARRLGYSESTLARACQAAAGQSPKALIDARTLLEARRLLVHSDASVAAISHRLGFSEPTNFVKFFARQAGTTPQAFRRDGAATAPRHRAKS